MQHKKSVKKNVKRIIAELVTFLALTCPTFATDIDPVDGINSLISIFANIVSAIGVGVALWGIVQFGLSFSSHDASQRVNGLLFFAGGIVIIGARALLNRIVPGAI